MRHLQCAHGAPTAYITPGLWKAHVGGLRVHPHTSHAVLVQTLLSRSMDGRGAWSSGRHRQKSES